MPTRLKRYYNLKHLHFITCSCYHRLGGWPPSPAAVYRLFLFLSAEKQMWDAPRLAVFQTWESLLLAAMGFDLRRRRPISQFKYIPLVNPHLIQFFQGRKCGNCSNAIVSETLPVRA
jgi:hypothetical protein